MTMEAGLHKYYFKGDLVCVSPVIVGNEDRVLVTRRSILTRNVNEMFINTSFSKLVQWGHVWPDHLIQDFFPELSAVEREFLLSGIQADEWEELSGEEDY